MADTSKRESNPRLAAAFQKLSGGITRAGAGGGTEPRQREGGSDVVADTIRVALEVIDEDLQDPSLPRGTRINLLALRPVLATLAAVTLRWEELLSTAVVELRSPLGQDDVKRFAGAVAYLLPTDAERQAVADRMVAQVRTALAEVTTEAQAAMQTVAAAVPKSSDHAAAAQRVEEAARRGATSAVQKEMGIFNAAHRQKTQQISRQITISAGLFVAGVVLGIVLAKGF